MSSTTPNDSKAETTTKTPASSLTLTEKRKSRKDSRKARRVKLKAKINTDAEFKKAYFEGKTTRALARVTTFKKAKKGKK